MIGNDLETQRGLFKGDLGSYMHDYVKSVAAPIFWQTWVSGQPRYEAGGTCFFLRIGDEPIIVTASHVYEEYCRRKSEVSNTCLSIGNQDIILEDRLISTGKDYGIDLATFRATDEEAKHIGKTIISGLKTTWPPKRVKVGERILFGGYPGIQRRQQNYEVDFGLNSISCVVESVNDRGFAFQVPRNDEMVDVVGNGQQDYGEPLGGISGAPVLIQSESDLTIITMTAVGVVYSGSTQIGEIVQALHIDMIDENYMIRQPVW